MAMPHEHIGARIRRLRIWRVLTQAQLAERVGVSRTTVAMWETGAWQPTPEHVRAVARALGVGISLLWEGAHEVPAE